MRQWASKHHSVGHYRSVTSSTSNCRTTPGFLQLVPSRLSHEPLLHDSLSKAVPLRVWFLTLEMHTHFLIPAPSCGTSAKKITSTTNTVPTPTRETHHPPLPSNERPNKRRTSEPSQATTFLVVVLYWCPLPGHDFKRTGLLRAGFDYQDLVAIEVLIEFYRDRSRYEWVTLEAEDGRFRSIEDVVSLRPNGKYELIQVKFAADPYSPASSLSWSLLTRQAGRSKSLLQKWSETTIHHKQAGTLEAAVLKTDRIPDHQFAESLSGCFVHYQSLSSDVRCIVDQQIGSTDLAKSFFNTFKFVHSQPRLEDLESRLWNRIASDTDRGGWSLFREQVRDWSTRRNRPAPDGRIRFRHLRQAFAIERPKPIPQNFLVPDSYSVPDDEFDRSFLDEITRSDGVTVLYGPPGRGKSTYLSHCVTHIDPTRAACVRHHYFLSLKDRSEGRFHYHAIFRSLKHQIESAVPSLFSESPSPLGELLERAAHLLHARQIRLIVIVDGLDHVWRDHRDRDDMEALFDDLLPLPTGVRLVVGTQKIARQHLPSKLLQHHPEERWAELPAMSLSAVQKWLKSQDTAGRLSLDVGGFDTREEALRDVAGSFHEISVCRCT